MQKLTFSRIISAEAAGEKMNMERKELNSANEEDGEEWHKNCTESYRIEFGMYALALRLVSRWRLSAVLQINFTGR